MLGIAKVAISKGEILQTPFSDVETLDELGLSRLHRQRLQEAFDLIDTDHSGEIMSDELGTFLAMQGEDLSEEDLEDIIHQIDHDGASKLDFSDFAQLMKDEDLSNMATFDIAAKFTNIAKSASVTVMSRDPLWKQHQMLDGGSLFGGGQGLRMKLAMLVDGQLAQAVLLGLIAIDVVCVIVEVVLFWTMCPCGDYPEDVDGYDSAYSSYGSGSSYSSTYSSSPYSSSYSAYSAGAQSSSSASSHGRQRQLRGAAGSIALDRLGTFLGGSIGSIKSGLSAPAAWTEETANFVATSDSPGEVEAHRSLKAAEGQCHKGDIVYSDIQYEWHEWLHWISVGICCILALQILVLMLCYRLEFFKNFYYVLDLIVVAGALTVELTSWFQTGPLFVVLLSWRMLRVLHGVATSVELQAKQKEEKLEEQRDTLQKELQASRRELAKNKVFYYSFMKKLEARGVKPASQAYFRSNCGFRTEVAAQATKAAKAGMELQPTPAQAEVTALKVALMTERAGRSEAEAMYAALYDFMERHHDHLKGHEAHMDAHRHQTFRSGTNLAAKSAQQILKKITSAMKDKTKHLKGTGEHTEHELAGLHHHHHGLLGTLNAAAHSFDGFHLSDLLHHHHGKKNAPTNHRVNNGSHEGHVAGDSHHSLVEEVDQEGSSHRKLACTATSVLHALHFGHYTTPPHNHPTPIASNSTIDNSSCSASLGASSGASSSEVDGAPNSRSQRPAGTHLGTICSVEDFNEDDDDDNGDTDDSAAMARSNCDAGKGTFGNPNQQSKIPREESKAAADDVPPQRSPSIVVSRSMSIGSEIQLSMLGSFDSSGSADSGLAAVAEDDGPTDV